MSSLLGTKLGARYRLESRIGSGGMAAVYRAYDETLARFVAVKLMHREFAGDSHQLERFRREARAVARISHPNVVQVIDAGEEDGRPFIVLECVEGETLKERIRHRGALDTAEATAYAIGIARALGAAHDHHVIHRDVKPQNVLIDHEGTAKVTDFGIARTLEEKGLTADGRVLGTTDYVSPEQALGRPVNGQSDLYSLGVVLYEMLTGELPHSGDSQVAVAMAHVRGTVPDVRSRRPEVSATLAGVVAKATAKQLSRRYASADEMIAGLELALAAGGESDGGGEPTALIAPDPVGVGPLTARRRSRPAGWIGAAVALTLAVAAVAVVVFASRRGSPHHTGAAVAQPIALCSSCANAYNPYSISGGTAQNNNLAYLAVDGKLTTGWPTQQYYDRTLGKPGVGIYVYTATRVLARTLRLATGTPGFEAEIYATDRTPDPSSFPASGWTGLTRTVAVKRFQSFSLDSRGRRFRYYLVWITRLPPGREHAEVNEINLYH
ncbi:protein kinase [Conexibacter sp. S30A1]|jgi:serine/threonine-protein kinase|uniref:protein kinase domain-containing protein n=1 Tax=Conexibacter sp. S30A1 TaxID=2937800 RepID=UPI00200E96E3|nr:protein kinase [Conexibacter sp. S30A1]